MILLQRFFLIKSALKKKKKNMVFTHKKYLKDRTHFSTGFCGLFVCVRFWFVFVKMGFMGLLPCFGVDKVGARVDIL